MRTKTFVSAARMFLGEMISDRVLQFLQRVMHYRPVCEEHSMNILERVFPLPAHDGGVVLHLPLQNHARNKLKLAPNLRGDGDLALRRNLRLRQSLRWRKSFCFRSSLQLPARLFLRLRLRRVLRLRKGHSDGIVPR